MAFPWLDTGEGPPNKGKKMPLAQRKKLSLAKKELIKNGWRPWNTGKTMNYSKEHTEKLKNNWKSLADKIRKYKDGDIFMDNHHGYKWIYKPDHPSANSGGAIHLHRYIAEKALGRPFKKNEVVHHVNGDKTDNRNCNLLICSNSYHRFLHSKMAHIFQQIFFAGEVI